MHFRESIYQFRISEERELLCMGGHNLYQILSPQGQEPGKSDNGR